MQLPIIEPNIKLDPMIKLIGSSIVSSIIKSTLLFFELFLFCLLYKDQAPKQTQ